MKKNPFFFTFVLMFTLACAAPSLAAPTAIPTFDVNQLPTMIAQTAQALALSATATDTPPPSETPSPTFTPSAIPSATFTETSTPSETPSVDLSATVTLTPLATETASAPPSLTSSATAAPTRATIPSVTAAPSLAPASPAPSKVPSATLPPTRTKTPAPTWTVSLTATRAFTPTLTLTPTLTFTPTTEVCPQTNTTFEAKVIELINAERTQIGLPALTFNSQLTAAAQLHSADQACNNYFSHTALDGSNAADRVARQNYTWSYVGENIAAGYATPKDAINGWMNSPGHKANILNPNFTEIGLGYAYARSSAYGTYWTAVFAKP